MERQQPTLDNIRATVQALGADGKEISHALVFEAMGLETEADKAIARARVTTMAKHGELTRTERGSFIYNSRHRPRQAKLHAAIWRFVRASKPGWSVQDCALMTRASYTHVLRYVGWLEGEGFLVRAGQDEKRAVLYRNTEKARSTPETPYPPIRESDPFAKERVAAASITRLMLCANPYAPKTAREITEACKVLLARFEKQCAEIRTENENREDCHVE